MWSKKEVEDRRRKTFLATALASNRAIARHCPESKAVCKQVAGGYAFFNGEKDPGTQAVEIGLNGNATEDRLDELERFFRERNVAARIVISDAGSAENLILTLRQRGYAKGPALGTWWRTLPPSDFPLLPGDVAITRAGPARVEAWARTVATGFREQNCPLDEGELESWEVCHFAARASVENGISFLATRSSEFSGGGRLQIEDGVGLLRTASVRFRHRCNGVQRALIAERLKVATEAGCEMTFSMAEKGSASERNLRRFGFELLHEGCLLSKE